MAQRTFTIEQHDELLDRALNPHDQPRIPETVAPRSQAIVDDLVPDAPERDSNPFPETVHAHRSWHSAVEMGVEARRLAEQGQFSAAMGWAAISLATRDTAQLVEPVTVGMSPQSGYDIDLRAIRSDIGRILSRCGKDIRRLEAGGLPLPWFQTALASISGVMASADLMTSAALVSDPADLPTLEQTLALAYVNMLARCLRLERTVRTVSFVLDGI